MPLRTGTREEWLAARVELLEAEKELTRRSDELARQRQQLPWVAIEKDYRFQTEDGPASLIDLFGGRSQLLVQHMMFPGCPSCASVADGYNGFVVHLEHHDVAVVAVSRYRIEELTAFKRRMGWSFPYVSSFGSDFNFDFEVADADAERGLPPYEGVPSADEPPRDAAGMSAFALEDGVVYHTYSAYARGTDVLWGMYQWLDRAPKGRNDTGRWYRLRDEYENESGG
jgi:predicted dithiol-disulfide oxidoreductase (DUF899 family)